MKPVGFLISTNSVTLSGANYFLPFYQLSLTFISIASVLSFLCSVVTELSSSKRSLKKIIFYYLDILTSRPFISYIVNSVYSCLYWNMQIRGQCINWDVITLHKNWSHLLKKSLMENFVFLCSVKAFIRLRLLRLLP